MSFIYQKEDAKPVITPPILTIYGQEGIGKTTLASQAPAPYFLDTEGSTERMNVRKSRIRDYDSFMQAIDYFSTNETDRKTLVIDTMDWLESLIHAKICTQKDSRGQMPSNINDSSHAATAYGKGHALACNMLRFILDKLEILTHTKKMTVILLAHAAIKKVEEPDEVAYDHRTLKMNDKFSALLIEKSTAVIYIKRKTELDSNGKPVVGERQLICGESKAFASKNRLDLPNRVEWPSQTNGWQALISAVGTNPYVISTPANPA